ncbi:MAG: hypothetical protein EBV06_15350 [Planctomycetia bacterium]|nr:hypothetical protein [Planctomycetia bacterium]
MNGITRNALFFACILALSTGIGCSETSKANVSGKITLDGKPLPEGLIRFLPADGQSQNADATIKDGQYTATMPPGEKRVEITAPKVVGKRKMYNTPDSPTVDEIAELLPAKYNTSSDLKLTVKAGTQEKSYELSSK